MKKYIIIIIALGVCFIAYLPSIAATEKMVKDIVKQSFRNWENGEGSPFDLLKDDASWTILVPAPSAGTYTIQKLRKEVLEPIPEATFYTVKTNPQRNLPGWQYHHYSV